LGYGWFVFIFECFWLGLFVLAVAVSAVVVLAVMLLGWGFGTGFVINKALIQSECIVLGVVRQCLKAWQTM